MQAKTHEVTGISFAVMASTIMFGYDINQLPYSAALVAGATIGSLLPDIDHGGSKISREHKFISKTIGSKFKHRGITHSLLANFIVALVTLALSKLLHLVYNDMAVGKLVVSGMIVLIICILYDNIKIIKKAVDNLIVHGKLAIMLLVAGVSYYCAEQLVDVSTYLALGISIGYLSHLVADACTVSGIALLQPFSHKTLHLAKFHTGENEWIFRGICVVITIVVMIWRCL